MQLQQDEVLKLAKQAQVHEELCGEHFIYEFAKLIASEAIAKEREACAQVCDKEVEEWGYDADVVDCAIAIRERGQ